jgi:hypothetical protein
MAKNLNLPTTVGVFYDFLDGESVAPYGDMGTTVIDILQRTVRLAIYQALSRTPSIRTDEFEFLRCRVFPMLALLLSSEMTSVLPPINVNVALVVRLACYEWASSFAAHLPRSSDEKSSVLSNSQVLSSVKNLLQDCDEGKAPTQIEEFRLIEISQELLLCMRRHLTDLKDVEETARRFTELRVSVRGMNSQEGLDGDLLPWKEWQDAWNQPFRGQALAALETKLQLNAQAIRTDIKKEQMSRIIPVVQASGTGKSRLSEEYGLFLAVLTAYRYVKKKFAVMLCFKNGSSFPSRVCL